MSHIVEQIMNGGEMNGTISDFEESVKMMEKMKLEPDRVLEGARVCWPLAAPFGAETDNPPRVLKPLKNQNKT